MAETVAEPQIENLVIPPTYIESAKSVFKQARVEEGLDQPATPPQEQVSDPDTTQVESTPTEETKVPDIGLPEDVLAPTPKEEEPKVSEAIAAIEKMELPKGAKEKTIADFGKLKTKAITDLTAAEKRIQELESKISASTSNSEIEKLNEKLKAAEQKAAEIEDQWAKTALETSPQFQRQFVKREQAELESAKAYLEGTEIDPRIIDYAARTVGATRIKVLTEAGLTPELIASVNSHLAVYDGIQRDKATAVESWKAQGAQWQAEEQKRIEAQQAQKVELENKIWEDVMNKNLSLLPFRNSKNETWNSRAIELRNKAKEIFNGQGVPLPVLADTMQKGVAYDALQENVVNPLLEKVKTLEAENAKLRSAAPGGQITQSNGTLPSSDPSKVSREELSKSTFNSELAKTRG